MEVIQLRREQTEARGDGLIACLAAATVPPRSLGARGGAEVGGLRGNESRVVTALFHLPMSDPFSGYFFTWTWRHRVSDLEREGALPWEGGEGPNGQDWGGGLHPPSLPPHIGTVFPFLQAQLG